MGTRRFADAGDGRDSRENKSPKPEDGQRAPACQCTEKFPRRTEVDQKAATRDASTQSRHQDHEATGSNTEDIPSSDEDTSRVQVAERADVADEHEPVISETNLDLSQKRSADVSLCVALYSSMSVLS